MVRVGAFPAILTIDSSAATVPKATHEPQNCWSLIGVTKLPPLLRQSSLGGQRRRGTVAYAGVGIEGPQRAGGGDLALGESAVARRRHRTGTAPRTQWAEVGIGGLAGDPAESEILHLRLDPVEFDRHEVRLRPPAAARERVADRWPHYGSVASLVQVTGE